MRLNAPPPHPPAVYTRRGVSAPHLRLRMAVPWHLPAPGRWSRRVLGGSRAVTFTPVVSSDPCAFPEGGHRKVTVPPSSTAPFFKFTLIYSEAA